MMPAMNHAVATPVEMGPGLSALAALPAEQVLAALDARAEGLSPAQARQRLNQFGPNQASPPGTRSLLVQLLHKVANPLNFLLLGLSLVSLLTGNSE